MNLFRLKPHVSSISTGDKAELVAADYLKKNGLKIIQTNFNCKVGEIDIIAQDKNCIVFVEVRYRKSAQFGGALESVNWQKQQKLIKTAMVFLQKNYSGTEPECRFDVIALQGNTKPVNWIQDAFEVM